MSDTSAGVEVWRGGVNTWECDEMGHMNVRFYVARMMEGLAELAHVAGLEHAFRPNAPSTLAPRDQHIRFIKEAHAGKPWTMTACVLEVMTTSRSLSDSPSCSRACALRCDTPRARRSRRPLGTAHQVGRARFPGRALRPLSAAATRPGASANGRRASSASSMKPGAVPSGLRSTSAPSGKSACLANFIHDFFQTFFKLTTILGPCNKQANIQLNQFFVGQSFRYITVGN